MKHPKSVPAKAPTKAPAASAPVAADDRRAVALKALREAGNVAFTYQKAIEQGGEGADKSELQNLLAEAEAKAKEAEAAVITLWDEGVSAAGKTVGELEAKVAELAEQLFGANAELQQRRSLGATVPQATERHVLVVTAKQPSRWRCGMNFTKEQRVLELEGADAISEAQFEAIRADTQLVWKVEPRA